MKKTNKEKKDIQKIVNKIVKKPQNALLALVNSLLVCKDESMFKDILLNQREYRKVASRSTCYYSENQVFGGATN